MALRKTIYINKYDLFFALILLFLIIFVTLFVKHENFCYSKGYPESAWPYCMKIVNNTSVVIHKDSIK